MILITLEEISTQKKIGSDGKVEIVTSRNDEKTLLVMVKSLFVVSQAKLVPVDEQETI
jgi:hypothetical protein